MSFNSYTFVLYFLPITVILFFLAGRKSKRAAACVLTLASAFFYGYNSIGYLLLLVVMGAINWTCYRMIRRIPGRRKVFLWIGILSNLALLFFFKYLRSTVAIFSSITGLPYEVEFIVMPLGLSFLTFQQIAFLVDASRKEIVPDLSVTDYIFYILYFPKMVSGPIVLPEEILPQIRKDSFGRIDWDRMMQGFILFVLGMGKKVLLADQLSAAAAWVVANPSEVTSLDVVTGAILYVFQLYFDFSGYTDMARGISGIFGIDLPFNFASPLKATAIQDTWNTWHMTLGRFLTRYVYFPLGGSKKGTLITYRNIMAVFIVSGIWHGASPSYLAWGLLNGIASAIERYLLKGARGGRGLKIPAWIGFIYTTLNFYLTTFLFETESISKFIGLMKTLILGRSFYFSEGLLNNFTGIWPFGGLSTTAVLIIMMAISACIIYALPNNNGRRFKVNYGTVIGASVLLAVCVMYFGSISSFLYFNF